MTFLIDKYSEAMLNKNDAELAKYVDDVEMKVGKPGIAEKLIKKYYWITGKTSFWWIIQKNGLEDWLWRRGVYGGAQFDDLKYPLSVLKEKLENGPVVLGTKKMGGLKGGHIILVVGYNQEKDCFICHDPFGNANKNYIDHNGNYVKYDYNFLKKYSEINGQIRCLYWRRNEKNI
jgi:hypothetical protein